MIDLDLPLSSVVMPEGTVMVPAPGTILMNDPTAKVRLSHSTNSLMRSCERKFQKTKLLVNRKPRDNTPATLFGGSYGAAAQHYMTLRSMGENAQVAMDSAIYEAWLNWYPILEDDRRFQTRLVHAIQLAQPFHERMLMEWEIPQFNGRFATELSFRINIDERYYYVGYIDLVLKNRRTGRYAVTDYKTTSLRGEDLSPYYKFADQVMGYSIVLDTIVGQKLAEYDTNYWVCQLASNGKAALWEMTFKDYTFPKNLRDRFEWFLKLYLDVNYMKSLEGLNVYPRRTSCMNYNNLCTFFGDCQFTETDTPAAYEEDVIEYDFTFELADLFQDHQDRLNLITHA